MKAVYQCLKWNVMSLRVMSAGLFVFVFAISGYANANATGGNLLYVGLTENGWQVFQYDLASQKETQVTNSFGDKRSPQYFPAFDAIVFRDAFGKIKKVTEAGEELLSEHFDRCAEFSLLPGTKNVFYTWWAEGNRKRHHLWQFKHKTGDTSIYRRPPEGSFSHLAFSPVSSDLVVTQIFNFQNERLVLLHPDIESEPEFITPLNVSCMFPSWTKDGRKVLFSMRKGVANYDLYEYDRNAGSIEPLLLSDEFSECRAIAGDSDDVIIYEQRSQKGVHLALLNRETKTTDRLNITREAKEPFWYPVGGEQ